jgi:hypothetical protein
LGVGGGLGFASWCSVLQSLTRSCAKCSLCRAFSTHHTLCFFSVGACVMPHMLCTKA